jgi:hypothetical protein
MYQNAGTSSELSGACGRRAGQPLIGGHGLRGQPAGAGSGEPAPQVARCVAKYFSEMGGHWDERDREWTVRPHSGNYNFFEGGVAAYLEGLIFINGVRSSTILGSPLFLNHAIQNNVTGQVHS